MLDEITWINPENIIDYNLDFAKLLGLIFLIAIIAIVIVGSRKRNVRKKPI